MIYICTGDNKVVEPDPLSEGFNRYAQSDMEHLVFEFLLNYVRRFKSDKDWRKLLKKNPEKPFLLFVTTSDIAFILALIKNGLGMWEQGRRLQDNPTRVEKKALPLFTKGEGQERESGRTIWNNEGLNFYYTAERNWKKLYSDKDELSDLFKNGKDGSLKTRVERIQSGHTGGGMKNRKMKMRRRNQLNGGKKNKMWGTLRMMRSLTIIGMTTSKMEMVMVLILMK
jgi:hypothetical protein